MCYENFSCDITGSSCLSNSNWSLVAIILNVTCNAGICESKGMFRTAFGRELCDSAC
jgi:hypothetical protein